MTLLEEAAILYVKARDARDKVIEAWEFGVGRSVEIPIDALLLINSELVEARQRLETAAQQFVMVVIKPRTRDHCGNCGCFEGERVLRVGVGLCSCQRCHVVP